MGKDLKGKELGVGIHQRPDGVYEGRYTNVYGKRKSIRDKDLRQLKKEFEIKKGEMYSGIDLVDDKMTLNKWFAIWDEVHKRPHIKPTTRTTYHSIYNNHIKEQLGRYKLSEIRKTDCQRLLNNLKDKGYGWAFQDKVKVVMADILSRALEDNLIRDNPTKGVRTPSYKPKDEPRVLTKEQQELFFECAAGTFYYNMFVVAVSSGLRPGELCALKPEDIDFEKGFIDVNKTFVYQKYVGDEEGEMMHEESPKQEGFRKVPIMSKECFEALKDQIRLKGVISSKSSAREHKFNDRLFVSRYNTPVLKKLFNEAIKKIIDEINLQYDSIEHFENFSGHAFRHTFATNCFNDSVNPKVIQKWLGHKTLKMTTDLYVHVTDDLTEQELHKVSGLKTKIKPSEVYFDNVVDFTTVADSKTLGNTLESQAQN